VENIHIPYNFSHFAIYLPKLITKLVDWKFNKVLTETKMHGVF